MKKLGSIFMAIAIFVTSCFSNLGVVFAATTLKPGEITASKTASVIEKNGRSAEVSITASGNKYSNPSSTEREIVLVLDASNSMKENNKFENLKTVATNLVTKLLSDTNNKNKIGIVWYETKIIKKSPSLSSDLNVVKNYINARMDSNDKNAGGTNVQLGIEEAKKLFTKNSDAEQSLIVLSDGVPTYYNEGNVRHGDGAFDAYEDTDYYSLDQETDYSKTYSFYLERSGQTKVKTCEYEKVWGFIGYTLKQKSCVSTNEKYQPSYHALNEARDFTGDIYAIGFDVKANGSAEKFLNNLANANSKNGKYYAASNVSELEKAFANILIEVTKIATDVKITDNVPKTFSINKKYMIEKYGAETVINDNVVMYGNKVTVIKKSDGSHDVIYNIGDFYAQEEDGSQKTYEFKFVVDANEDYYGSMFTNDGAILEGNANGNPCYAETNKVSISLKDPSVSIPAVAYPDDYKVERNKTLTVNSENGVRDNDYKSKLSEDAISVTDKIVIKDNVTNGVLTFNEEDGSFTYVPSKDFTGTDEFTYSIVTTVKKEKNGEIIEEVVESNVTTVTILVYGVKTSYTVRYLEDGTNNELHDSKVVSDVYVNDVITENALSIKDYKLVSNKSSKTQTITLVKDEKENTITFYYEKCEGAKVTVHHYLVGTTKNVAPDQILSGKLNDSYTAKGYTNLKDYDLVSEIKVVNGKFTEEEQEITFYYDLKNAGKVTVHHYLVGTTISVADDEKLNGKVNEKFTANSKKDLDNYIALIPFTYNGTFKLEEQEITFYYDLKEAGEVTVHHYIKGTTTKVADDEKLNGKVTEKFNAKAKTDLENYELVSDVSEVDGEFKLEEQEITFYYNLKEAGEVTVHHYIKGTTTKVADDEKLNGKVTKKFTVKAKTDLENYELVSDVSEVNGVFKLEKQEITFYYDLKEAGEVTVHHYIKGTTTKVADDEKLNGKVTEKFNAKAKTDLENYELVSDVSEVDGEFKLEKQEITFYYNLKDAKVRVFYYEEGTTNSLADEEVINGKVGDKYTTEVKDILGWELVSTPKNNKGTLELENKDVIYYYKKVNGNLIINYVDQDGKELLTSEKYTKQVGTDYAIEAKEIEDYELSEVKGNETGKYTKEDTVVTYVYEFVKGTGDGEDPMPEPKPEIDPPYTGIEGNSNTVSYITMGISTLSLIILAILKKKFN